MPSPHTIRCIAALAATATAAVALAATAVHASAAVGQPPPEWAANARAWPAHNYDLANTRATTQTPINSQTVSRLKIKWTFAFKGTSGFGAFASTPISLNGTVYLQDLNSNVYALDRTTGGVNWQHKSERRIGSRRSSSAWQQRPRGHAKRDHRDGARSCGRAGGPTAQRIRGGPTRGFGIPHLTKWIGSVK